MATVQFFYDYECPFCKKGYEYLEDELAKLNGKVEIEWRPMEAHPAPDDAFPPHTYLACQSYYIAKELGADMKAFHAAMFQAIAIEKQDVEKPEVLCSILKNIVDTAKFLPLLTSGKYAKQVDENNDLAYNKSEVWFIPAFRTNGKKLDAQGGIGITPEDLGAFLKG